MQSLDPQWHSVPWDGLSALSAELSASGSLTPAIHVWQAELGAEIAQLELLSQWLSMDERDRADRFYFEHHRRRFIMARGILRSVLGGYLAHHPSQIRFCYSSRGKPSLAFADPEQRLYFNVSHSEDLSLYAIAGNPWVSM
ncbi:MAG: hypothetical protein HC881_02470 [Leptolyngbyaceae cyanobacterium SL_7_1]|nr:hypothetical protein [Leptolyngbyaceae cyanobacterium SL_7_1]